jgi:hypothetical protein
MTFSTCPAATVDATFAVVADSLLVHIPFPRR